MKKICFFAAMFAVSSLQAQIVSLPNAGFEEPGENSFPGGFDGPGEQPNVPGWFDLTPPTDAGIEGPSAWWGTYDAGFSAFMAVGNGAYNISDYTIQAGDQYVVSFVAKSWDGSSEWTVGLFYDEPDNVIGTISTGVDGTWTEYSLTPILPTTESIGGTLGISFLNSADTGMANLDDVSILVIPEPSTYAMIFGFLALAGAIWIRRRSKS